MSDKAKFTYPVPIDFADGEQPTAQKLSNVSAFTRKGLVIVEYIVGDPWGLSGQYTVDAARQGALFDTWGKVYGYERATLNVDEAPAGSLPYRDAQIANLSRLVGPSSALNPDILPNLTVEQTIWAIGEPLDADVNTFKLLHAPLNHSGSFNTTATWSDAATFNTEVASADLVSAFGDYHVSQYGVVTVASPVVAATTVAYSYLTIDGESYSNSSYNVIPDPNQTAHALINGAAPGGLPANACTVTVDAASKVRVQLPYATHAGTNLDTTNTELAAGTDPNYGPNATSNNRLQLPDVLSGLAAGEPIPEGFLYLYDNKLRKVVGTIHDLASVPAYYYVSQTEFDIIGLDSIGLEENDAGSSLVSGGSNTWRYSVITVGTTITQSIAQLRKEMRKHTHLGISAAPIEHSKLVNRWGEAVSTIKDLDTYNSVTAAKPAYAGQNYFLRTFTESEIAGNDHPQYLHRFGYKGGGTDGNYLSSLNDASNLNDANVLRGDLVFGHVGTSGYSWESGDALTEFKDSHSIFFGKAPSSDGGITAGCVRMFHDSSIPAVAINTEADSLSVSLDAGAYMSRGLNFQRGNIFFGIDDPPNDTDPQNCLTSIGARVNEFTSISNATAAASVAGTEAYQVGHRLRAISGSSLYHAVRGIGVDPTLAGGGTDLGATDQDQAGYTGIFSVEATNSDTGMHVYTEGSYYGKSMHGAAIIASPGGGKHPSRDGASVLTLSNGFCRWVGSATGDIGDNRGGILHLVAASDQSKYLDIAHGVQNGMHERFQDTISGTDHTPWGRIALDSDRGIDLIVRNQCKLHEENNGQVDTNDGGGNLVSGGSITIANLGSLSEVRFAANTDYTVASQDSSSHCGADANFFYKYGKQYKRHNVDFSDGNKGDYASYALGTAGWRNGRLYKLIDHDTDGYGSNILGANMVEAFGGVRSDPNQPPVLTYVFPFENRQDVDVRGGARSVTSGSGTAETADYWFGFDVDINPYATGTSFPNDSWLTQFAATSTAAGFNWPVDADGRSISWDQVIKHHDNEIARMTGWNTSGNSRGAFGHSVVSIELQLQSWWVDGTGPIFSAPQGPGANLIRNGWAMGSFPVVNPITPGDNDHGNPIWIPPCSGGNPWHSYYVIGDDQSGDPTNGYYDSDGTLATGGLNSTPGWGERSPNDYPDNRMLWQSQELSQMYYTFDIRQMASPNYTYSEASLNHLHPDYVEKALGINILFGSNPWNLGVATQLPYGVLGTSSTTTNFGRYQSDDTTPAAVWPPLHTHLIHAEFEIIIVGRLVVKVHGVCPYNTVGDSTVIAL
tara:strand:- start:67956 stop:71846 length:3891 start_codon:yes stop_codon:yes gene_type:complete